MTPDKYVADPFTSNLVEIKENEEPAEEPLIDEPVTGAGNDDLWVTDPDCERADAGECRLDEENQ